MIGMGQPPLRRKRTFDWIESELSTEDNSRHTECSMDSDIEFVCISTSNSNQAPIRESKDWCEEFSPASSKDLVGNTNKISELSQFLRHALLRPGPAVLLLTGPPGCGKLSALRVLGREGGAEVLEWIVPATVMLSDGEPGEYGTGPYSEGQFNGFKSFLIQNNYASVIKDSSEESASNLSQNLGATKKLPAAPIPSSKRLLIVKDIPNTFFVSPLRMREVLRVYARRGKNLLAFILSSSQGYSDTCRKLFPAGVLQEFGIVHIDFNAVHTSGMKKVVSRVMSQKSGHVDDSLLNEIVESSFGDLRFALNTLQFYLYNSQPTFNNAFRKATKLPKQTKKKNPSKQTAQKSAPSLTLSSKNFPLSSLHAVGKVLHSKRQPWTPEVTPAPLPPHLALHSREELQYQPDHVFDSSGLSNSLFLSYLHRNIPDYFLDIDELTDACSYLSSADLLSPLSSRLFHASSHYAPLVASLGISHSLSRCAPSKFKISGSVDKQVGEKQSISKLVLKELSREISQIETDPARLATGVLSYPQLILRNYPTAQVYEFARFFKFNHRPNFTNVDLPSRYPAVPPTQQSSQISLVSSPECREMNQDFDQSLIVDTFDDDDNW